MSPMKQRLFKKSSYLQVMLRKATWQDAWLNLRRAGKDRRARKQLLALGLLLLLPLLLLGYLAWLVGTGSIYFVPFVIPVIWLIRRGHKQQDTTSLRIAPAPEPLVKVLTEAERAAIRGELAILALVHAVLLDRAGSELYLKKNEVPDGREVVSRRLHLELLKKTGAWERLAQADREALIAADGSWDRDWINRAVLSIEQVRLLRWILQLDAFLPFVGQQMKVDYMLGNQLVREPGKVLEGSALVDVTAMETGRDAARAYLYRLVAEMIKRGYQVAPNEEAEQWANRAYSDVSGDQNEDLLLGEKLVSEASEEQIRWATALAQRRTAFLDWAIAVMEGQVQPERQFPALLAIHATVS
jgi:hypothetical protein